MNTTDEFLKALMELESWSDLVIEYRLHYDDAGDIIMCSMANHPESTQYVIVSQAIYNAYYNYTIQDGKPKLVDKHTAHHVQLKRSSQGYRVVQNHAGIILDDNEECESVEYYDNN
jgi:hypothetical protein